MNELDEIDELHELLKLKHLHLEDAFEELKRIRNKLKCLPTATQHHQTAIYEVEDMVQNLIWRVGHYIGEF